MSAGIQQRTGSLRWRKLLIVNACVCLAALATMLSGCAEQPEVTIAVPLRSTIPGVSGSLERDEFADDSRVWRLRLSGRTFVISDAEVGHEWVDSAALIQWGRQEILLVSGQSPVGSGLAYSHSVVIPLTSSAPKQTGKLPVRYQCHGGNIDESVDLDYHFSVAESGTPGSGSRLRIAVRASSEFREGEFTEVIELSDDNVELKSVLAAAAAALETGRRWCQGE